jgi:hypothetical protein
LDQLTDHHFYLNHYGNPDCYLDQYPRSFRGSGTYASLGRLPLDPLYLDLHTHRHSLWLCSARHTHFHEHPFWMGPPHPHQYPLWF